MKSILSKFTFAVLMFSSFYCFAWGLTGHRVIAEIHRDLLLFFNRLFQRLLFQGFRFIEIFFQHRKQHRVEHNGEYRACQHQSHPHRRIAREADVEYVLDARHAVTGELLPEEGQ